MKEKALKLADELDALHQYVPSEAPTMIRRLIEELDKQKEINPAPSKELLQLKQVHTVQGQDGTWNYDNYMTGLFNGLELALAIFENRKPEYKDTSPQKVFCECGDSIEPNCNAICGNCLASMDTSPQTKPLSDDEIYNCMNEILPTIMNTLTDDDLIQFARAIEERHGIK